MRARLIAFALAAFVLASCAGGWMFLRDRSRTRLRADLDEVKGLLSRNVLGTARFHLDRLVAEHPDSGEVLYLLGALELADGRPGPARAAWMKVSEGDDPHFSLAALHLADMDRSEGGLASAENRLRRALPGAGPHRHRLRLALAHLLEVEGRKTEALEVFDAGFGELPDPVDGLKTRYTFEFDPYPAEAVGAFLQECARNSPDDERVALALAHHAIRLGRLDEARSRLDACLAKRPTDRAGWEMRLEHAVESRRPDQALNALEKLPATSGLLERLPALRLWSLELSGDRAGLRAELEHRLVEGPVEVAVLERLAELEQAEGRSDRAKQLRARRLEFERNRRGYLQSLDQPIAVADAPRLASAAAIAGRPFDERFWSAKGDTFASKARALVDASRPDEPGTLAEADPSLARRLRDWKPLATAAAGESPAKPFFRDRAAELRLDFKHDNGAGFDRRLIPPVTMSGGVALLDYDGDGRLDLYAVQGGPFPPSVAPKTAGDRLFHQKADGTFEDVTDRAGLGGRRGYGHGATVGDFDGDGRPDLFVTRWRSYALYRNLGDGRFEDATAAAGLTGDRDWPTSAVFADLDGDGDLDLYVCHYFEWDADSPRSCVDPTDPTVYRCSPRDFKALPDHLFRNDGGRFVDVTKEAGIVDLDGRGLGVVAADFDGDGRVDLYVANDMSPNYLWRNLGGFRFEEAAAANGAAANAVGGFQAGMGVACGDLDGDGTPDLAVTNYYNESTSFFRNLGRGFFRDATAEIGLAAPSRYLLGFGVAFFDADDDGRLDLVTANGHIHDGRPRYPWRMPLQLLRGDRSGRLVDVSADAGEAFRTPLMGRGLAVGDLDNDGRTDLVVQSQGDPLLLLHNETEQAGSFVGLDLVATRTARDAVGAVATIKTGGRTIVRHRIGGGSYLSASDGRIVVGLGEATAVDDVAIRWPSGSVEHFQSVLPGRYWRLTEGASAPAPLVSPRTVRSLEKRP